MAVVYLKEPHNLSKRTNVVMSDIDNVTVQGFKNEVAKSINKLPDEFMLMYAGRVLKHGRTLSQYNIIDGVTVFVLTKKEPVAVPVTAPSLDSRNNSQLRRLIRNPRVNQMIQRMMSNPTMLNSLVRGSPLEGDPSIRGLVQDPSSLSDPEELIRVIEENEDEATMVEEVLRTMGANIAHNTGRSESEVRDDELIDMMEQSLEEDMETLDGNDAGPPPDAQEQSLTHQQTQQSMEVSPPPPLPPQNIAPPQTQHLTASNSGSTPAATNTPAITPELLSSALSSAMASNSHFLSPPQPSSSGPSSLPSQLPPSNNTDGGPASLPTYVRNNSDPGSVQISQEDLSRALQSVIQNPQQASVDTHHHHQQHHHHHHREGRPRSGRHHRYQAQLQQLYGMGLRDDAACVHALDATDGDINAALELLLGSGQ